MRLGLAFSFGAGPPRRAAVGAASSFISATVTAMSRCAPLRQTVSVTFVPGLTTVMIRGSSDDVRTSRPSTLTMMSPASTPPFSAGPPFSTELTSAPMGLARPNDSAVSLLTSCDLHADAAAGHPPLLLELRDELIARSIGIAKASPM